jgi:DnaJ like chaperone protein
MSNIWTDIAAFVQSVVETGGRTLSGALERIGRTINAPFDTEARRQVTFTVAMIALSAKMAKADGIVTFDEIQAFEELFTIPKEQRKNVARLFNLAKQDVAGFESYARQLGKLCRKDGGDCTLLEDIVDGLFHIAKADGVIHERELDYLQRVADVFEIAARDFRRIKSRHLFADNSDPYNILGVDPADTLDQIKKIYRKQVFETHPDQLMSRGVPEEFLKIANDRLAVLNAAYATIEKEHRG